MSLGDDAHAALGGIGEDIGKFSLRARLKMNLGFFEIYKATWIGSTQRDEHRKDLRDADTYVGDVIATVLNQLDIDFDRDVVDSVREYI